MICEKARNDHSEKLWKLHESLQNHPELKTRDPAMVKRLIEWEAIVWPPACRNPIEVIEGTVTLEQQVKNGIQCQEANVDICYEELTSKNIC